MKIKAPFVVCQYSYGPVRWMGVLAYRLRHYVACQALLFLPKQNNALRTWARASNA
jgi:hypothetical protein